LQAFQGHIGVPLEGIAETFYHGLWCARLLTVKLCGGRQAWLLTDNLCSVRTNAVLDLFLKAQNLLRQKIHLICIKRLYTFVRSRFI
jgi:hypothetical protein